MKPYFYKLFKPISIQVFFTILYSLTVALFPILNKYLFDNILDGGFVLLAKLCFLYIVLIIFNSFFQYISRLYEWVVSKDFNIKIKSDLFLHIVSLKNKEFEKKKASDYLSIFNNNIEVIYEDYISAYIDLLKSFINIIVFACAMFVFLDYRIALTVFVLSIFVALIPKIMQKKLSRLKENQLEALRKYFARVLDLLSGKKNVSKYSIRYFEKEHKQSLSSSESSRFIFGKVKTISDTLGALGVFIIQATTFALVGFLLVRSEITIGTGIAAFGYVRSFLDPIRNILECLNSINSSKGILKETLSYLSIEPLEGTDTHFKSSSIEKLEVDSISYKANDFVFKAFSYTFERGKIYAISGHSGSGKSTLMGLIDGRLRPTGGQVRADNVILTENNISDYIFSLNQFEYLFKRDFISNITILNSMVDPSNLASKLLDLLGQRTKDTIQNYEHIDNLSGGEKQIIALLRLLVSDRPILLLDESFSSIDIKNTQIIKDYILSLKDKIIIEVTHDISSENLNKYDQIITFNDGEVEDVRKDFTVKISKGDFSV